MKIQYQSLTTVFIANMILTSVNDKTRAAYEYKVLNILKII